MTNKIISKVFFVLVLLFSLFGVPPKIHVLNRVDFIDFLTDNNLELKIFSILLILLFILFNSKFKNQLKAINELKPWLFFFVFKLFILLKYFFQIQSTFGLYEITIFISLLYVYAYLSYTLNYKDFLMVINLTAWIFIILNIIQYVYDYSALFISNRFISLTGNSNHAAVIFSIFSIFSLIGLQINYLKFSNYMLLIICLPLLIITGSKTGLFVIGLYIILYFLKDFKMIGIFTLIIIPAYYLFNSFDSLEIVGSFERISNFQDTRSANWNLSLQNFYESPFIGSSSNNERLTFIESSYLACLENYGIIGFSLFLISIILLIRKIYMKKFILSVYFALALLFGGLFEAYLLSSTNLVLHTLLIITVLNINQNNINENFSRNILH